MSISKEQARDIARAFLDVSHALGSYRFARWGELKAAERRAIEDAEWTLLNYSSDLTTTAVGIALDDLQRDLKAIRDATASAKKAVSTIRTARQVIGVATALTALGGALASKNPAAIAGAAGDLARTVGALG